MSSYIDKNSSVVVSARLTDKGRELLSVGLLNFNNFVLGDSEIDYSTLGTSYDITLTNILTAASDQPKIKTTLLPTPSSINGSQLLGPIQPLVIQSITQIPELGFFYSGSSANTMVYTAYTDTNYTLQSDLIISLSALTGYNSIVPISQSNTYGSNTYQPKVGDLLLVKMSNDELSVTQNKGIVEETTPVPYLWYNILSFSGSVTANTYTAQLDRNFAYFAGYSGDNYCWVSVYPSGDTQFRTGGLYSAGTVWNQSNVWSKSIIGVDSVSYEDFEDFQSKNYLGSKEYFGYTSEFNDGNPCDDVPSIVIINYSNVQDCNNQSETKLGKKFYIDTDNDESPILKMPTLMWHGNQTNTTIGHKFTISADTLPSFVQLSGSSTDISYYDLSDQYGLVVGRVFPQYQLFTIHNQELVAALSYKSNRNWTLPTIGWDVSANVDPIIDGTESLYLTYLFTSSSGYTSGLHSQNFVCANFDNLETDCPPLQGKAITVTFPPDQLIYMNMTGGTGWYADKLYLLAQKTVIGTEPDPNSWILMDYTSQIDSHTIGTRINPDNVENTVFTITQSMYNSGSTYNLHDYINIPTTLESNVLQFGDESFFYGSIAGKGETDKYRTKFLIQVPPNRYNTTNNPTFIFGSQYVHISEVGVYSSTGDLVAIGKMNLPIEKAPNTTIIIEIAFDL